MNQDLGAGGVRGLLDIDCKSPQVTLLSWVNNCWSTLFKRARYCRSQIFILCGEAKVRRDGVTLLSRLGRASVMG